MMTYLQEDKLYSAFLGLADSSIARVSYASAIMGSYDLLWDKVNVDDCVN